jgi:hypothetical protein
LPPPYLNQAVNFDLELEAGEHWLAFEWDYENKNAQSLVNNFRYNELPASNVIPEPSTLLLLSGGVLGLVRRFKK